MYPKFVARFGQLFQPFPEATEVGAVPGTDFQEIVPIPPVKIVVFAVCPKLLMIIPLNVKGTAPVFFKTTSKSAVVLVPAEGTHTNSIVTC